MVEEITEIVSKDEFESIVNKESKPIIVDFWAMWCGPCKMQAPIFHAFAKENAERVRALKVNVDECEELAALLEITAIPTILVIKDGEVKERSVGLSTEKDLSALVLKHL